ncbi:MAG: hypothetical protein KatS3mg023_3899 [Armatimonadota bacterium]|nr:MAG: hypothetical protein KatS3mg023_3899 [Armatimonadota bacterium]
MAKAKMSDKSKWIQQAIEKPGALRRTAKRMGLIKGTEKLSQSDLDAMAAKAKKTGNTKLLRRVNLARTLKRLAGK